MGNDSLRGNPPAIDLLDPLELLRPEAVQIAEEFFDRALDVI